MEQNQTPEWQSPPCICRCCSSAGCYKDLTGEYFWLGKREVYSELLLDVFNITLSNLSENSRERLICEVCITRLRAAANFKNQVLESEKKFLNHINSLEQQTDAPAEYKAEEVKEEVIEHNEHEENDNDDFSSMDDESLATLKSEPTENENHPRKSSRAKKGRRQKKKVDEQEPTSSNKKNKDLKPDSKDHSEKVETFQSELRTKCNSLQLLKHSNMTLFRWCKNKYRCFCCKETFLDPKLLKTHSSQHNLTEMSRVIGKRITPFYYKVDVSDLRCKVCYSPMNSIETLIEHLKDHDLQTDGSHLFVPYKLDSDVLKCQMCSELYKSYVQLDKHMNMHYKNHICETCGKSFKTHEGLRDHTKRHKQKQHVCKKCDIVFGNYYRKRQHDIAHHNLKVGHVCPYCPETFNSYHNRLWHLVKVHSHERPEFKCVTCEKVFYNNSLLRSHIRKYHLQERNVQCDVCNTKFFRKCDLTEHMKNHTKERKFVCTFCGKSFVWKKNLNIHLAIHNNVRRHVCSICGKSFVQGTSLKYHMGRHHAKDGQIVS